MTLCPVLQKACKPLARSNAVYCHENKVTLPNWQLKTAMHVVSQSVCLSEDHVWRGFIYGGSICAVLCDRDCCTHLCPGVINPQGVTVQEAIITGVEPEALACRLVELTASP